MSAWMEAEDQHQEPYEQNTRAKGRGHRSPQRHLNSLLREHTRQKALSPNLTVGHYSVLRFSIYIEHHMVYSNDSILNPGKELRFQVLQR